MCPCLGAICGLRCRARRDVRRSCGRCRNGWSRPAAVAASPPGWLSTCAGHAWRPRVAPRGGHRQSRLGILIRVGVAPPLTPRRRGRVPLAPGDDSASGRRRRPPSPSWSRQPSVRRREQRWLRRDSSQSGFSAPRRTRRPRHRGRITRRMLVALRRPVPAGRGCRLRCARRSATRPSWPKGAPRRARRARRAAGERFASR